MYVKRQTKVVTKQPAFKGVQLFTIAIRHPLNLRVIGPDTALFNWQIARKLKWWKQADRIIRKLESIEPKLKLAYTGNKYEVHERGR